MKNRKRDTDLQNSLLDSEGEGEGSIEKCVLSRVKQITGPGWMHETSARTWCPGRTWRERVEREVGGGIGMGNTCEPKAFSFQCMTKLTTKKKKKTKIQKTSNPKKKKKNSCLSYASKISLQAKTTSDFLFIYSVELCNLPGMKPALIKLIGLI